MSYSFNVRAASKSAARAAVSEKLSDVIVSQPIHEADRLPAQNATAAFIELFGEPEDGQELSVSVSGSVAKWDKGAVDHLTNAGLSINVAIVAKAD